MFSLQNTRLISVKQISFEVTIKVPLKPVNIEGLDVADLRMIDSFVRS